MSSLNRSLPQSIKNPLKKLFSAYFFRNCLHISRRLTTPTPHKRPPHTTSAVPCTPTLPPPCCSRSAVLEPSRPRKGFICGAHFVSLLFQTAPCHHCGASLDTAATPTVLCSSIIISRRLTTWRVWLTLTPRARLDLRPRPVFISSKQQLHTNRSTQGAGLKHTTQPP